VSGFVPGKTEWLSAIGDAPKSLLLRTLSNHAYGVAGKDLKFSGVPEE
jgi:hypothetical protein